MVQFNSEHITEFETLLSTTLNHELNSVCEHNFTSKYLCEINRLIYTSHDIYKFIKEDYTQAKQLEIIINKSSVPISQFDIIIDAANEDGNIKKYVLQRISTEIFKNPEGLMNNIVGITKHIRKKNDNMNTPWADRCTLTFLPTKDGKYFLYVNGGEDSKYPAENITRMSAAKAKEWLSANNN